MRGLAGAAVALGLGVLAQGAQAADMPFLRGALFDGPRRHVNWGGFYVGGQAGYGSSTANFARANDNMARDLFVYSTPTITSLAQVPALGKASASGNAYGGFVGYNSQWTDVVLGLEASFLHGTFRTASTPTALTNASSLASVEVKDYGSVRARAGYVAGPFLPYLFGGLALGRADIRQKIILAGITSEANQNDKVLYGYAAGAGVDLMLTAGLFMRAEYEYQRFTSSRIDISSNTVRAGLGYKF